MILTIKANHVLYTILSLHWPIEILFPNKTNSQLQPQILLSYTINSPTSPASPVKAGG